ncbi:MULTISPECIES: alpha/beta hydrolase family protein [Bacillus]|uniref:alpha/beta hydrolase family protein n=1 Tax=Bacillus TaxID=1386 RepID=UPI000BECA3C1|nr:dienelactone hydrolase family protein [Bacillus pseudomycoides]MCR8857935.1 dienelactone hydrolase family protein [Bacillus pseudomycoides]PDZ71039.1 phospholipase [Bacillus pseudomycoides]PEF26129.1 phospholipase [Bacillus pseudomycoides]PGD75726.1 phospholipase [Bacillus pseudomycoides]
MNQTDIQLGNIHGLLLQPTKQDKKITIVFYHGWGSSIYHQIFLGTILTNFGYTVIIPEIIYHDSRTALENHFSKPIMEQYFWKTILHTVKHDINDLFTSIYESEYCLGHKIVVLGSSMGGFISSGAWITSEEIFQKQGSNIANEIHMIRKMDPIQFIERIHNRPILLLHGASDAVVSPLGQQTFCEKVQSHHQDTTANITFMLYQNINHSIRIPMIEKIVNWLDEQFVLYS